MRKCEPLRRGDGKVHLHRHEAQADVTLFSGHGPETRSTAVRAPRHCKAPVEKFRRPPLGAGLTEVLSLAPNTEISDR